MKLHSLRRMRGVAAVELAILLIPLLILTFGMTEIGRAVYYYNTLLKSTRDAARYLSMMPRGEGEATAVCLAVYGSATCGSTPVVSGLDPSQVHIQYTLAAPTGSGSVDLVTVTISGFSFEVIPPLPLADSTMVFTPIATTMRQGTS